jgi:cobalt-zinc-cadmium resistance protein CzcA
VADVQNALQTAVAGKPFTQMIEGEKSFDVTLRWPERLRESEDDILDIPVDVIGNTVTPGSIPSSQPTPVSGGGTGVSPRGTSSTLPERGGSVNNPVLPAPVPRRRLRELVMPAPGGRPGEDDFTRAGVSMVYREQGQRMVAVKFGVRGRDLAGAVADAQEATADLFKPPYRAVWSGEFQEMQQAERRLMFIIPVSLGLIVVLLYTAFHSLLDVFVVLSNVLALSLGGVWALLLTGTHFSISAAVGFISIFGVAVMDGLLLVSYFNHLRARGVPLRESILRGSAIRVRPVMMTALTAIFGLLPAAFSTRIGAQTQRPLAIVVVGGMILTLIVTRYLMPILYSFYGHREPPAGAGGMAH